MQQQQQNRSYYDLFLHRYLDNQQAKSVTFMKLDSHPTLYRDGIQNKYLTNLVIGGRNYIQVIAIFQNQITLSMGVWHLYEDIVQVQQWDKNIVLCTKNKVVGLIYEDCIIKNSFMLSLSFLQLGYREYIQTVCDKFGYYMVIATSRQILLCISQKSINKYKSRPFSHTKCSIIQQDIKWNRSQHQSISQIIKFQLYDYQLSKVQSFHYCDQHLYFIGYNQKSNFQKHLYQIPISQIFSDNQKNLLILKIIKLQSDIQLSFPIRKQHQTQYINIKIDNSIYLINQKGQFLIDNQFVNPDIQLICKKNNNSNIFPLQIYYNKSIYIYQRNQNINNTNNFVKKIIKLPEDLQIQFYDFQDYLFAYCNLYQVGLIFINNNSHSSVSNGAIKDGQSQIPGNMVDQDDQKGPQIIKLILKQSYGNIIDFNVGQNLLILQNTYKKKCRLRLLKKGIIQHPKPFIMHSKKISLQSIPQIKYIKSLQDIINDYLINLSQQQTNKIKSYLSNYLIIQNKSDVNTLYRLVDNHRYEPLISQFQYHTLMMDKYQENNVVSNKWYLLFWYSLNYILYYELVIQGENNQLKQSTKIQNINLWQYRAIPPTICKIKNYIISIYQQQLQLTIYKFPTNITQLIKIPNDIKQKKSIIINITNKNIVWKKKDKDSFFFQLVAIIDGKLLQIWEICVEQKIVKLSHWTDNIGEGLPILLPTQTPFLSNNINSSRHQFRAISCPQYVLADKTITNTLTKSPTILKMFIIKYQLQNYLLMINSLQQLQVYKKQYCISYTNKQNPIFGNIDIGFLYHRQTLQLNIIKKFKYQQQTAFIQLGCGMIRVCNLVFFKGQLLQFPQNIRNCFQMQNQIWSTFNDNKIKLLITQGKIISHFIAVDIPSEIQQEMVGVQATNQNFVVYSRTHFQVYDKELNSTWKFNPNDLTIQNKQYILTICAYDHYIAVSYYNFYQDELKNEYQSIKFKIRIYNTITKKKIIQKDNSFDEPVLHIRYVAPDKLVLVTSSNVSVNTIKNNQTLQNYRNKHYSKRGMISCFSYAPQKIGSQPGYMIFGGLYGGLTFYAGQWIDKDKLEQICFQNLKCGINQVQIFRYGGQLQMSKALVADNSQNIIVLDLRPKNTVKIADFHIGSTVTSIKKRYQIPYIACCDGCIRMLLPIKLHDSDINFLDFQQQICKSIPLLGGFNNRDSRLLDQRQRTYKITSTGPIVDGQLIRCFLTLTQTLKNLVYQNSNMELDDLKNQLLGQL